MLNDDFFEEWLDEESRRVQNKIKTGQVLDSDDKTLLILKAQTNHFHHLDIDLREEIKVLRIDMDQRFVQMQQDMDKRFEQVDKRFEQVDKRFEQVDKRFEQVDKRFEQMDKRFEQTQEDLKRLYQAINTQTWKMIGAIGLIVILARLAGGIRV